MVNDAILYRNKVLFHWEEHWSSKMMMFNGYSLIHIRYHVLGQAISSQQNNIWAYCRT